MAWTPSVTELYTNAQLYEQQNFTQNITYVTDEITPESWIITISSSEINSTVILSGGTTTGSISGFYSGAFDGYNITYMKDDLTYSTVTDWDNISGAKEINIYRPAMQQYKTFYYTATATPPPGSLSTFTTPVTQTYSIVVTNSWTVGMNNLKSAVAATIARRQ